ARRLARAPGSRGSSQLPSGQRVLRDDRYQPVQPGRRQPGSPDGSGDRNRHRSREQLLSGPGARPTPDPLLLSQKDGDAAAGGGPAGTAADGGLITVFLACPNRCSTNRFELWNASVFVDTLGRYLEDPPAESPLCRWTQCGGTAVGAGGDPTAA